MHFLVIDDDPALGLFLARALEADGHQVRLAGDGQAAVDNFAEQTPALAILDLDLPRRDGVEVLGILRSMSGETPILVLTARSDMETRVKCLDLGADDYMLKPFALAELRARCRALLRRSRDPDLILRQRDLEVNRVQRSVRRDGQVKTRRSGSMFASSRLRGQFQGDPHRRRHVWPSQQHGSLIFPSWLHSRHLLN